MTVIAVPYHLDEYLPDLDLPLEAAEVVTARPRLHLASGPRAAQQVSPHLDGILGYAA